MNWIKNLSQIDTNLVEGRLFMAALAKLTTESQTDKDPDEVLVQCINVSNAMFKDANPIEETKMEYRPGFEKELTTLINRYSKENESDTPDFIISEYISNCLTAFNGAVKNREKWHGRDPKESPEAELLTHE